MQYVSDGACYIFSKKDWWHPNTLLLASSTAVRACETLSIASAVAGLADRRVSYYADLEEFDQGEWTGRPKHWPLSLPDGTTTSFVPMHERDHDYSLGGTETISGATQRVMSGLQRVAKATPENGVAIISGHGIVNRLAAIAVSGADILGTRMDYGAETRITIDGDDWHVDYVGLPTHEPNSPLDRAIWRA